MRKQIALVSMSCLFLLIAGMMPAATTGAFTLSTVSAQEEPAPAADAPVAAEETVVVAEEEVAVPDGDPEDQLAYAFNNTVLFFCACLVMLMQAGFAMVEAGMNSSKNVVNILAKNLMDMCVGVLLFYAIGFGLMYSGNYANPHVIKEGFLAFGGFGIYENLSSGRTFSPYVDWFFQAVFAATAATIVSGAVAGRMQFKAYLIYTVVLTAFVYPISGYWTWGGGWLKEAGFTDFAGSVIVHAVGGFAGLAGAIVLGPRLGRFSSTGTPQAIPAHNLALSALGVFILWFGWYGFNPGSQLLFASVADTDAVMLVAVNTTLAAGAGGCGGMILAWILFGKPDLSMAMNGVLAGLVGITANCHLVTNNEAIIVGAIAGVLVVLATIALDKLKIDDPVGAFPVHGVCGVWGGLCCAIFGGIDMMTQLKGILAICGWSFVTMFILFMLLKVVGIIRVTAEEEEQGLDISEHGMHAYIH